MTPADKKKDDDARALFRPGLYRHYKGGEYSAVALTRHHDSGRTYVMYSSMATGSLRIRPLVSLESHREDADCWMDQMADDSVSRPRFRYLGPLP